jgi:hypothetical protein
MFRPSVATVLLVVLALIVATVVFGLGVPGLIGAVIVGVAGGLASRVLERRP